MKRLLCLLLALALLSGCTAAPAETSAPTETTAPVQALAWDVTITLSDETVGVDYSTDGASGTINSQEDTGVYTANDIVYYEAGHDFTYGEGEANEAHTAEEAAQHTVVHITKPGSYRITGSLSAGQIAVDLGEEAETDPNAVVTLILDNVDITCTVAPAVIFYNVYECGDKDNPSATVDTSAAGANVILAEGSRNYVNGSHVARIYEEGTVTLSEDGTEVAEAVKLHKYDGAFYSKMSMNIGGEGFLHIAADNEGLDSELHLTINGGEISILSGNDGINTNEDGVSVTTVNGGTLRIEVTGTTGEGDGIDSNGWLVINGGTVFAYACSLSGDAGIDSDMGIHINGGTVMATGNMLDRIEDGGQTHAVFTFAARQEPGTYTLKNAVGETVLELDAANAFQYLILSAPAMTEGTYTLWQGETQYQGIAVSGGMAGGIFQPIERPEWPEGGGDVEIPPQPTVPLVPYGDGEQPVTDGETIPEGMEQMVPPGGMTQLDPSTGMGQMTPPEGDPVQIPTPDMSEQGQQMPIPEFPGGETLPEGETIPGGMTQLDPSAGMGQMQPGGGFGRDPIGGEGQMPSGVASAEFAIVSGANYFTGVTPVGGNAV